MTEDEIKDLQAKLAAAEADRDKLKSEMDAFKSKSKDKEGKDDSEGDDQNEEDDGLRGKARKARDADNEAKDKERHLESALQFNMQVSNFVKENKDILPAEIEDILRASEKEKYDSAFERSNAVKSAFIQSFFSVQANVDLLTAAQKRSIDEYLKLTKNGREQKAEFVFENVFEPALELLKRIKKAEEVGRARSGFSSGTGIENKYKERLIAGSKKTYLGEKQANG